MTIGLTPRARELLVYLSARELCPTYREMARAIGASTGHIARLIDQLEAAGKIRRLRMRACAIEVIDPLKPVQPPPRQRVAYVPLYGRINLNEYPTHSRGNHDAASDPRHAPFQPRELSPPSRPSSQAGAAAVLGKGR